MRNEKRHYTRREQPRLHVNAFKLFIAIILHSRLAYIQNRWKTLMRYHKISDIMLSPSAHNDFELLPRSLIGRSGNDCRPRRCCACICYPFIPLPLCAQTHTIISVNFLFATHSVVSVFTFVFYRAVRMNLTPRWSKNIFF